jgi:hypothetical protein
MNNGQYENAVDEFDKIDVSWEKYEQAKAKKSEAENMILVTELEDDYSAKEYEKGIQLYRGNVQLLSDYPEAEETYLKCLHEYIYAQIETYKADDDYVSIIQSISDYYDDLKDDAEILKEFEDCKEQYRTNIISEAEKAYKENGYVQAVQKINEGLGVLSDDEILLEEKEKYQSVEPVSLFSIEPYAYESGDAISQKDSETDIQGNVYENVLMCDTKYLRSNTYDIQNQYNTLKAVVAINEDSKGETGKGVVRIYGDGTLLYEKKGITSDTKAFPIEVNITGVTDLRIDLQVIEDNEYFDYLDIMLCDITLEKTLK